VPGGQGGGVMIIALALAVAACAGATHAAIRHAVKARHRARAYLDTQERNIAGEMAGEGHELVWAMPGRAEASRRHGQCALCGGTVTITLAVSTPGHQAASAELDFPGETWACTRQLVGS
jgi:hypothetical protein